MATKWLKYIGPQRAFDDNGEPAPVLTVADDGHKPVTYGVPFDVDADVAGVAPTGEPGDEDYDEGSGLLAQVGNFEESKAPPVDVDTIPEVLAAVGDDPAKAWAALEAENARGPAARKTLLGQLEAIYLKAAPTEETT